MLFSVRVLCKQCALFLSIVVVAENTLVLCDKTGSQQVEMFDEYDSIVEAELPPREDLAVENNELYQSVIKKIQVDDIEDRRRRKVAGMWRNRDRETLITSFNDDVVQITENMEDYSTSTPKSGNNETSVVESWCVIWYLGAFGSLVCFFLIITCTELFFGNPLYRDNNLNAFVQSIVSSENKSYVPETPPPPYHLFAPPDYYETIQKTESEKRKSLDVFVVPVHTGRFRIEPPPCFEEATCTKRNELEVVVMGPGRSNPED